MIPAVTSLSVFFFLLRGILHILSKEERERDERLNQRRENLRLSESAGVRRSGKTESVRNYSRPPFLI